MFAYFSLMLQSFGRENRLAFKLFVFDKDDLTNIDASKDPTILDCQVVFLIVDFTHSNFCY